MSAAPARKDLIEALHRLAGAGAENTDRRLSEALEAAGKYAVALGRTGGTEFFACCRHCAHGYTDELPADQHTVPCREGCNDKKPALCRCGHLERVHNTVGQSGSRGFCTECEPGRCGRYEAARPGQAADAKEPDAAAQLAEIRAVFEAFEWERDDRQYALEQIDDIVNRDGSHG